MLIVGIDPGKEGGYVELDELGTVLCTLELEPGLDRLCNRLSVPTHVFVERAQVMARDDGRPKAGAVSSFNYGVGYGVICGILRALRLPHTMVRPADWTRMMHQGTTDDGKPKSRSLQAAKRLFPHESWLVGKRSKPHDGLFEAALIAEYGRRTLLGRLPHFN